MKTILMIAAAGTVLSSAAWAQTPAQAPMSRAAFVAKLDVGFKAIDANHDGYVNEAEFQTAQNRDLQQAQAQARTALQARFKQLDTNKDGKLSFDEFVAIASVKPTMSAAQILQQLDTNHDGKVSPDEFRAPRVAAFNKIDANHDGIVTVEEMKAAQGAK